jgi:hypothetical protein
VAGDEAIEDGQPVLLAGREGDGGGIDCHTPDIAGRVPTGPVGPPPHDRPTDKISDH